MFRRCGPGGRSFAVMGAVPRYTRSMNTLVSGTSLSMMRVPSFAAGAADSPGVDGADAGFGSLRGRAGFEAAPGDGVTVLGAVAGTGVVAGAGSEAGLPLQDATPRTTAAVNAWRRT